MTIETITVTDALRVTLDYDDTPECPRGWGGVLTSFVSVGGRHGDTIHDAEGASGSFSGDLEYAHDRASNHPGDSDVWMRRWMAIFHPEVVAFSYAPERAGYWFLTRAGVEEGFKTPDRDFTDDVITRRYLSNGEVYGPAEILAGEIKLYETWARGEVYGVTVERAVEWARVEPGGDLESADTMTTWETVESLWGIYPEKGPTLEVTALITARDMVDGYDEAAIRAALVERGVNA